MIVSSLGITYGNSETGELALRRMPRSRILEVSRSEQRIIAGGYAILPSTTVFLSRSHVRVSTSEAPTLLVFR